MLSALLRDLLTLQAWLGMSFPLPFNKDAGLPDAVLRPSLHLLTPPTTGTLSRDPTFPGRDDRFGGHPLEPSCSPRCHAGLLCPFASFILGHTPV